MEIFREWGHSFEEDTDDITVYRPAEYDFPLSRGRAGIEFKPEGNVIYWEIGPVDTPRGVKGHWRIEGPGRMNVSFEGNVRAPLLLQILQCDARMLKIRQRPTAP